MPLTFHCDRTDSFMSQSMFREKVVRKRPEREVLELLIRALYFLVYVVEIHDFGLLLITC